MARRILRIFPRRTSYTPKDDYVFVGHPPMMRPQADEVHISVTFTWDIPLANELFNAWSQYYDVVKIGGPALGSPAIESLPGMYVKPNVIFTSRGCNNNCSFCLVQFREGKFRPVKYQLPFPVHSPVINDNNWFQHNYSDLEICVSHLQPCYGVILSGGIDTTLCNDRRIDLLKSLRIHRLFVACDSKAAIKPLEKAMTKLAVLKGRVYCYALLGFNGESISDATERLETIFELGAYPFAILYQPPLSYIRYPKEWRELQRTFCRPAATKAYMKSKAMRSKD